MVIFHSYVSLPEGMFYDFGWCWIIFFEILVATHPIRNGPQCRATMIQAGLWAVDQNHRLSNYASISARNEEIASQPVHLEFAAFTSPKMGTTKPQFSIVGDKFAMVNGYTVFMSFTRDDASQKHTLHPLLLTWWQKWVGFPSIFWE
jgi:hypothetical protein